MRRGRRVTTTEAAIAVGRPAATIRDWHRKGLIEAHGTGRHRLYDLLEVQAVHDRLRSAKIAGHHRRLRAFLRDTPATDLDLVLDTSHAASSNVASHAPDDIYLRAGDYALTDPEPAERTAPSSS